MLSYCSHRIKFKNKKVYIYVYLFLDHGALKLGKQRKYVAHIKMLRRRKILMPLLKIRKKARINILQRRKIFILLIRSRVSFFSILSLSLH